MASVRSPDTTPEAQRVHTDVLRAKSPEERLELAFSMSEDARRATCEGIRSRNPDWSEPRVRYEMLVLLYGEELVAKAWGPPPTA